MIWHSPYGRRFKPKLRLFGVPGKHGPPPTRLRRVSGRSEVKPYAEIAEFSRIEKRPRANSSGYATLAEGGMFVLRPRSDASLFSVP